MTNEGGKFTRQFFNGAREISAVADGFLGAIISVSNGAGQPEYVESWKISGCRGRLEKEREKKIEA